MRRFIDGLYSLITVIFNAVGIGAPSPPGWTWTQKDDFANPDDSIVEHFREFMRHEAIRAGQFALHVDGHLVFNSAFTWAGPDYPVTETKSVMRVASCSKMFTTEAIMELKSQNLVRSDTKVFEFLGITASDPASSAFRPARDPRVRDITVGELMGHRGGWDYYESPRDPVFGIRHIGRHLHLHRPITKLEFATYIHDHVRLDFDPDPDPSGDGKYSNIGYVLLGMVVEKATGGDSFEKFLRDVILPPLGIDDVFVGATRESGRRGNEVRYEDRFMGPDATVSPYSAIETPLPYGGFGAMTELMDSGGGLVASARSLSRFIVDKNNMITDMDHGDRGRNQGSYMARDGAMPGTCAMAVSFKKKGGSPQYDYAFIFNQADKGGKGSGAWFNRGRLGRFGTTLEEKIQETF